MIFGDTHNLRSSAIDVKSPLGSFALRKVGEEPLGASTVIHKMLLPVFLLQIVRILI